MLIPVNPCPKPRMTRSDRWKHRDCTTRYWHFKDEIRQYLTELPQPCTIIFRLPMPKSWSKKKREEFEGKPHLVKPDYDNLAKALGDALYDNDSALWNVHIIKLWAREGSIEIYEQSFTEYC